MDELFRFRHNRGQTPVVALALTVASLVAGGAAASGATDGVEIAPQSGEAFFGIVRALGPREATHAELRLRGDRPRRVRTRAGRAVFRLRPGRYDLAVRFLAGERLLARARADDVFSLPNGAQHSVPPRRRDTALSSRLGDLGSSFDGYAAFWVHDLTSGRMAGWNADASFPAASLVKLGVLVAALDRWGAEPADRRIAKEIRDLAVWSSNLASNKLIVRLGGSERAGAALVTRTLHRLGATASTFTGFYRLGTAATGRAPTADAPRPLPLLTYRRTTARDTGWILHVLHAAALGRADALRRTSLSRHEARVALGLLLSTDPAGDNAGLLRRPLGPDLPIAQKHGWTTSLRHSAAIVYGPAGPRIVVLLTYRTELEPREAHLLGERLVDLLRPW